MAKRSFKVWRGDAQGGEFKQFEVEVDSGMVVLDVLHRIQAREANDLSAELYVGLRLVPESTCRVAFYATEGFESVGGRRLAELSAKVLGTVLDQEGESAGMRLPVLRETKMPAVLCSLGPVEDVVLHAGALAASLAGSVTEWVEHRLDD